MLTSLVGCHTGWHKKNRTHKNINNTHRSLSINFMFADMKEYIMAHLHTKNKLPPTKTVGWREIQSRMTIFNNPQNRGIFSTRKSPNTLFYPNAWLQGSLIALLRYRLIYRMFLHHHMSNFPQKCKNWGFGIILQLVPNPVFPRCCQWKWQTWWW